MSRREPGAQALQTVRGTTEYSPTAAGGRHPVNADHHQAIQEGAANTVWRIPVAEGYRLGKRPAEGRMSSVGTASPAAATGRPRS